MGLLNFSYFLNYFAIFLKPLSCFVMTCLNQFVKTVQEPSRIIILGNARVCPLISDYFDSLRVPRDLFCF